MLSIGSTEAERLETAPGWDGRRAFPGGKTLIPGQGHRVTGSQGQGHVHVGGGKATTAAHLQLLRQIAKLDFAGCLLDLIFFFFGI